MSMNLSTVRDGAVSSVQSANGYSHAVSYPYPEATKMKNGTEAAEWLISAAATLLKYLVGDQSVSGSEAVLLQRHV